MKNILAVLATLGLVGCVGTPHESAAEISGIEISVAKRGLYLGCRDQGRGLGHPAEQVERRCQCVLDTLNGRMSEEEWKRATFFAQQRRDRDEAQVFAPHMEAVKACK